MLSTHDVRAAVCEEIRSLLAESHDSVPELTGTESLIGLGLSSLTLARLLLQLEERTGYDPFTEDVVISDVRSVDDLVAAYLKQPLALWEKA
jgi:acyl carrier protein